MSIVEQWTAFCEHDEDTRADEERSAEDYRGYTLKASVSVVAHGLAMRIRITRAGSGHYREVMQAPAWEAGRFADTDAALDALLAYGRAIIDGEVPGVDVSVLHA